MISLKLHRSKMLVLFGIYVIATWTSRSGIEIFGTLTAMNSPITKSLMIATALVSLAACNLPGRLTVGSSSLQRLLSN